MALGRGRRSERARSRRSLAGSEKRRAQRGDRIESARLGVAVRGTVHYVDDLQVLVKWDDGRSENLRPSFAARLRVLERGSDECVAFGAA
jgi:hypothetical protein